MTGGTWRSTPARSWVRRRDIFAGRPRVFGFELREHRDNVLLALRPFRCQKPQHDDHENDMPGAEVPHAFRLAEQMDHDWPDGSPFFDAGFAGGHVPHS